LYVTVLTGYFVSARRYTHDSTTNLPEIEVVTWAPCFPCSTCPAYARAHPRAYQSEAVAAHGPGSRPSLTCPPDGTLALCLTISLPV